MRSLSSLNKLLYDLHIATGFRLSVHDTEFREIAAYPEKLGGFCAILQNDPRAQMQCYYTDRDAFERVRHSGKIHVYKCRFGLWEAACPLYRDGVVVGYLMMGQALEEAEGASDEVVCAALPYVKDREALERSLQAVPRLSAERVKAFARIITLCAEHPATVEPLNATGTSLAESVIQYINRNIGKELSVLHLCSVFHCSKSTLMKVFSRDCGTTLGEYIVTRRIDIAKELLQYTEEPIGKIAEKCGYNDPGYFSKVFSSRVGCSPLRFRSMPFSQK